jgi:hypothetical protein
MATPMLPPSASSAMSAAEVSLSREDQGGRRQVPDGSAQDSVAITLTVAFATAAVVSRSTAGCRVDASASHPLDSASASKRATSAY